MKIILSGGGTGGHIYPALALIRRLKEVNPSVEIMYIGTEKGLEKNWLKKLVLHLNQLKFKVLNVRFHGQMLKQFNFFSKVSLIQKTCKRV